MELTESAANKDSPALRPERALEKNSFKSLCIYQVLLGACATWALFARHSALVSFPGFDEFYILILLVQSLFGIFVLPYSISELKETRNVLIDYFILFLTAAPFVIVAAFASAMPWYRIVPTQMVVFGIWSVALCIKRLMQLRLCAGELYLPLSALAFLGLPVTGSILESFSDSAGLLFSFSVPGVLLSWSSGLYFEANGWLGITICLAAVVAWSGKLMWVKDLQESAQAGALS
jgi:hypothetical protein